VLTFLDDVEFSEAVWDVERCTSLINYGKEGRYLYNSARHNVTSFYEPQVSVTLRECSPLSTRGYIQFKPSYYP
jgi:hypothetical protein